MPDLFLCFAMCSLLNLLTERLCHIFKLEPERTADLVEGNATTVCQPPHRGRANAKGTRQGGGVHEAGVLGWAADIPLIRSIRPAGWDEARAGPAVAAHESPPSGLTSGVDPMMPTGPLLAGASTSAPQQTQPGRCRRAN